MQADGWLRWISHHLWRYVSVTNFLMQMQSQQVIWAIGGFTVLASCATLVTAIVTGRRH